MRHLIASTVEVSKTQAPTGCARLDDGFKHGAYDGATAQHLSDVHLHDGLSHGCASIRDRRRSCSGDVPGGKSRRERRGHSRAMTL
jgi:hypothetical protein